MLDERDTLIEALARLGDTLADRDLHFHVAIVGGAALLLTGQISRPTQDVDVAAVATDGALTSTWYLPDPLIEASRDVAVTLGLDPDWLNAGAVAVIGDDLPDGYETRLDSYRFGPLTVSVLSRLDLMGLKLLAAFDEGPHSQHVADLRAMESTPDELEKALRWALSRRDPNDPLVRSMVHHFTSSDG
ncbi:MAG: hypothetical protein EA388_15280 [Nitriliruptor sp.]|nr:MAG: hypothetical protein EA388_15280 [Nitriliruptor sp.]